ncbi:MAG: type II toxin-antitoxin system RelE/ParE family toxin [Turneriella sp.]
MAQKKTIIVTQTAQTQRLEILQYWRDRLGNNRYSSILADGFEHCLDMIARFPEIGGKIRESEFHSFTFKSYLIAYENRPESLVIHQFWDLRQNPEDFVL